MIPCGEVRQRDLATWTTIGGASSISSFVRGYHYLNINVHWTSMEWAILSYDDKSARSRSWTTLAPLSPISRAALPACSLAARGMIL
ncbi:hypothetical protein BD413DRAFT_278300 [Trametes elegans]|nr:hypothetical protein BD413DRAFT_278300 [Trametes elegans]